MNLVQEIKTQCDDIQVTLSRINGNPLGQIEIGTAKDFLQALDLSPEQQVLCEDCIRSEGLQYDERFRLIHDIKGNAVLQDERERQLFKTGENKLAVILKYAKLEVAFRSLTLLQVSLYYKWLSKVSMNVEMDEGRWRVSATHDDGLPSVRDWDECTVCPSEAMIHFLQSTKVHFYETLNGLNPETYPLHQLPE